jgi:hypothetical protein
VLNKPLAEASPRPEPQSAADAGKLALEIFTAVKSGNWGLAAALALMLVVYAARLFLLPKMNPQAVPLVVACPRRDRRYRFRPVRGRPSAQRRPDGPLRGRGGFWHVGAGVQAHPACSPRSP